MTRRVPRPALSPARQRPGGRRARTSATGARIRESVLASIACHAMVIGLALVSVRRHAPPSPSETGTIELVMQQQQGRRQVTPASQPAPQAPAPSSAPTPATPPETQPSLGKTQPDPPRQNATEAMAAPPPPSVSSVPKQPEAPPPTAQPAPTFDLSGADDYNAIAFGPNIIPAEPDTRYRNNPPLYPKEAGLRGERGTVVVLIHVSPEGLATGADVLESSGFRSLDNAALAAVRLWHFRPALHEGSAIPFDMPFRFVFEAK